MKPFSNPFEQPAGAFKNGALVKAWKIWPNDAYDTVDLDYDFIRPLSAKEIEALHDNGKDA